MNFPAVRLATVGKMRRTEAPLADPLRAVEAFSRKRRNASDVLDRFNSSAIAGAPVQRSAISSGTN